MLVFEHVSYQCHLTFFLDESPSVLTILWPLNRNVEASSLRGINFGLALGVDGQSGGLNVGFTDFPQAAFSDRLVLLPDPELLIPFSFDNFPIFLCFFEGKNKFIGWELERIFSLLAVDRCLCF